MLAFKPKDGGDYYAVTTFDLAIVQDSNIYFTGLTLDVLNIFKPLLNCSDYQIFIKQLNNILPSKV